MTREDLARAAWRTSSYSGSNTNCVEVTFLPESWRTSSYSDANTNCVEVAGDGTRVGVRDSKNAGGPVLVVGRATWAQLLTRLR